jgi:hypothetical protein
MTQKSNNTPPIEPTEEFMLFIKKTRIIVCRYKKKEKKIKGELEMELFYLNPVDKKITYHSTTEGQSKIQIVLEKQIRNGSQKEPLGPTIRNKIKEIELKKSGKKKSDKTRKPKESKTTKQPNSYRKFCRNFSK